MNHCISIIITKFILWTLALTQLLMKTVPTTYHLSHKRVKTVYSVYLTKPLYVSLSISGNNTWCQTFYVQEFKQEIIVQQIPTVPPLLFGPLKLKTSMLLHTYVHRCLNVRTNQCVFTSPRRSDSQTIQIDVPALIMQSRNIGNTKRLSD